MTKFPKVYTDVSYTLFDTVAADGMAAAIKADLSGSTGDRILFGTDLFMTLQEKEELALYKPTWQGGLLFICRNISGSDAVFAKFMKNDVDSAISLIRMFQGGTHKIRSDYSPKELELILIRAELSLRTFLKVEFDINRR